MINIELFKKLKEYLSNEYSINPDQVSITTSLFNDFNLYGDDIDDFFNRLIKDFNIEVKELNLSKYFVGDEQFDFFSPVVRFFKNEKVAAKPTLTIEDILRFIETGILK